MRLLIGLASFVLIVINLTANCYEVDASGNVLRELDKILEFFGSRATDDREGRDSDNSTEGYIPPLELTELINRALDDVINDTLSSVETMHGLSEPSFEEAQEPGAAPSRQRRSEYHPNTAMDPKYESGVQRLSGIEPLFPTCERPLQVTTTTFDGTLIGVCITQRMGTKPASVSVGELSLSARSWKNRVDIKSFGNPLMSAAFADENELRVMVADGDREGVVLYRIDKKFGPATDDHIIPASYPTAITVWRTTSAQNSDWHLAIADSTSPRAKSMTYKSKTSFYAWRKTYFDHYADVTSYDVRDICPFSSNGRDYVVIINHQAAPTVFNVDSELFHFDIDQLKWVSLQKIKTTGAVDCEVFTLGRGSDQEKYLAIANHVDKSTSIPKYQVDSVIYKFSENKFIPFQCIKSAAATQIKALHGFNGSFVLAVAHSDGVEMYQYNGWRFMKSPVQRPRGALGHGVVTMTTAKLGEDPVMIVGNPLAHREPNVFQFSFKQDTVFKDWHQNGLKWCENVKQRTSAAAVASLEKNFDGVFFVNQPTPITINGDLTIKGDVEVEGTLSAPMIQDLESHHNYSHELALNLKGISDHLVDLERDTGRIMQLLSRALRKSGDQVIKAPFTFSDVEFACPQKAGCKISEIKTNTLNGRDVRNLNKEIIRIDTDQVIGGNFRFENIRIENDLFVDGKVNGVNVSHLVTKSGNHVFSAPQTFLNDISTNDVNVRGLINGLPINSDTVLLKSTNQTVSSHLIFNDKVTASNLNVLGHVNGLNLNELLPQVVTVDGKHTIRGRKTFESIVANDLRLQPGATVAGVDIVDLYDNMLWATGDQTIFAPMNFSRMTVHGDLHVHGLLNGVSFPGNDIVYVNKPSNITGAKTFESRTSIEHMLITESINGIRRVSQGHSDWPDQLDILVKSRAQTISGKKVFGNLHLGGHSTIEGTVNGIKLSEFNKLAVKRSQLVELPGTWEIDASEAIFNDRLIVGGYVNHINLTHLYKNALKLSDQLLPGSFHFKDVSTPQMTCATVNGLSPERELMTKGTRQIIQGPKRFNGGFHVANDFVVRGSLNGMDIKFLNDTLRRRGDQTIFGPKIVQGDLYISDLNVPKINSVDMSDVVLLNSNQEQVITGIKSFNELLIEGDVHAKSLKVTNELNRMKVDDLFKNTMTYDGQQTVTGHKQCGHITIPKGTNLRTESVNGYNLLRVFQNAVLTNKPQVISGDKTFRGHATFANLRFHGLFDGVSDNDMKRNWLLQGENQTIDGDVIFENDVVIRGNLNIDSGTINGLDIRAMNNTIVRVNEPATITGPVTFRQTVVSGGDIVVGGTTQGFKLAKEAVTTQGNVQIFGDKTFRGDVTVIESLTVNGRLDDIFINDICRSVVRRHGDQVITAHTRVMGSLTAPSLTTGGTIDAVDVVQLNVSCVKRNEPASITGRKHFDTLILMAPVDVQGKLSGVDVKRLASEYMSKTKPQTVRTPIVFENGVKFNGMLVVDGNLTTRDGLVDGVSLEDLDNKYLKTRGDQVISAPYVFEGNVHFAKDLKLLNRTMVNGVPFDWVMMKNRQEQLVASTLIFNGSVEIDRNMQMHKRSNLQQVNMHDFNNTAIRTGPGDFHIMDTKHFNVVDVEHLYIAGLLNGVNFTRSGILLTTGHNRVHGKVIFDKGLHLNSILHTSRINNVDMVNLDSRLVRRGKDNTINGPINFKGSLKADQAVVLSLVNDRNLTSVAKAIYDKLDVNVISSRIEFCGKKLDKLEKVVEDSGTCLKEYAMDTYGFNSTLISSSAWTPEPFVFTSIHEQPCSRVEIRGGDNFGIQSAFLSYKPSSIAQLTVSGTKYLVVGSSHRANALSINCIEGDDESRKRLRTYGTGSGLTQVLRYDEQTSRFEPTALLRTEPATDIKVVDVRDNFGCFVVATPFRNVTAIVQSIPEVICIDSKGIPHQNQKATHQLIDAVAVDKFSVLASASRKLSVVAAINSHGLSEQAFRVKLYRWNMGARRFGERADQEMHAYHPTAVHFTEIILDGSSRAFFFVAEGEAGHLMNKPLIRIYKGVFDHGVQFLETQQIQETQEILSFDSLVTPDNDLIVFTLLRDSTVKLYKLRGASGFALLDTVHGRGASRMEIKVDDYTGSHFLILSTASHDEHSNGQTRILLSILAPKVRSRYSRHG